MSSSSASSSSARQRTTCRIGPNTSSCRSLARSSAMMVGRHEAPARRQRAPSSQRKIDAALPRLVGDPAVEPRLGVVVDHRTDMGRRIARIAERQFARGARDHLDHAVGHVLLHAEQPQRRAALAGRAERRGDHVVGDLLGQRGGIDDHGVDAAGLGDQRHDRAVLGGERAVDGAADLGRAGEGDAGDARHRRPAPRRPCRRRARDAARSTGTPAWCSSRTASARDQRRLLGGLGHHRIAGDQRRARPGRGRSPAENSTG